MNLLSSVNSAIPIRKLTNRSLLINIFLILFFLMLGLFLKYPGKIESNQIEYRQGHLIFYTTKSNLLKIKVSDSIKCVDCTIQDLQGPLVVDSIIIQKNVAQIWTQNPKLPGDPYTNLPQHIQLISCTRQNLFDVLFLKKFTL
jgi:hypothetical protein